MKKNILPFAVAIASLSSLSAAVTNQEGQISKSEFTPKMSAMEHYNTAMQAMEQKSWRVALRNFIVIGIHYPDSQVAEDAFYFQAVCNYHLMEYDIASRHFSDYLTQNNRLRYFEDALSYKLAIAEKFKEGAKKHLFDSEKFPKWASATEDSMAIYEEIISIIPNHELAAKALLGKANLMHKMNDFKGAIENFHTLIKRFPKHPLASDAYLAINEIYFEQSHTEYQNPDLLELAKLNLNRFIQNFPRDGKVEEAKEYLSMMEEIHAKGLYNTGIFYERTKKPKASVIYYVTALEKFPNAPSTQRCKARLSHLKDAVNELQVVAELTP
ncbi:MAG: Cell division coordinator CpoB [Chlamydiae bacterium]|nr:Cell division coordinator CpoB [Chlamydiota bacterium]